MHASLKHTHTHKKKGKQVYMQLCMQYPRHNSHMHNNGPHMYGTVLAYGSKSKRGVYQSMHGAKINSKIEINSKDRESPSTDT